MAPTPPPGAGDSAPPARPGSDHARTTAGTLDRGLALVRFLRAHCPWDARQTADSLLPYLLEESHEVADAIHAEDWGLLRSELGDLLLNLAFQVVVAEEAGRFTADEVARAIEEKMRRRHPHLYGDGPEVPWREIKAAERAASGDREEGVLSGVPRSLDPLSRAFSIQDRVAGVGFDWADWRGALEKVEEELGEVREELGGEHADALEEELGDLLFAAVNLVRLAGHHPLRVLDRANRKFTDRFDALERLARERGLEMETASLEELDALWDEVKARADGAGPGSDSGGA